MGLSKRERMIVLVTLLAVGTLVADKFVRAPIANGLGELRAERQKALAEVTTAKSRLQQKQHQRRRALFESLRQHGGGVANAHRPDARLTLVRQAGPMTGGDKGCGFFRHRRQGPARRRGVVPLSVELRTCRSKVKHLQLGSTSEAGDNMSLELRLTLYLAADDKSSLKQPQPKQPGKTDEEQLL
jgi:hypothetical protein